MFGKRLVLFELLGFKVQVDASWLLLALLVTWSLAAGLFPVWYEGLSVATYWWMGIAGTIGLVFSLVFHELSHSLVARQYGLPIKGITLFIFGGVAEMEEEPENAKTEFLMAIAGPIASAALAAGFYGIAQTGAGLLPGPVMGVVEYLALINALLAGFNLVPAFPLDGGRAFRAALWHWKGSLRWATRIAAGTSETFGYVLIALGVINFIYGNFIGGMWWFLIGLFLRGAANSAYQQLNTRRVFEGEPVRRFMTPDPVTVDPDVTLREFVEDYLYRYHHDLFPVVRNERLVGCIGLRQVRDVPREQWDLRSVGDVMIACNDDNTIDANADAVKALSRMRSGGNSRLMVVEQGRLVGIIVFKDMLDLFALKMDLEGA